MSAIPLNFLQRLRLAFRLLWSGRLRPAPIGTGGLRTTSLAGAAPPIPRERAPELGTVRAVVPIVQTVHAAGIAVTLISLETYDGGFLLHGEFSAKYGGASADNPWHGMPVVTAVDDTGTSYRWWPQHGSRGRFSCQFAPALNPNARQLHLTVTEIYWTFIRIQRRELDSGPWEFSIALD